MTELERAVKWLEHWKMIKECDARSYPYRTEHAEIANHCRVLLDALRWIPVTERLPDNDNLVSIAMGSPQGGVSVARYWEAHKIWSIKATITHWRALPEAPKEG